MNDARYPVAFAAGTCIAGAMSGAGLALTSMPAWAMLLTGAVLAACALHQTARDIRRTRSIGAGICGMAFALVLPIEAPPAPGAVSTRAVSSSIRGDLFDALAELDSEPNALLGKMIAVTGSWTPPTHDVLATVSRRIVSCCAADAVDVGFDVRLDHDKRVASGAWVRVEGIVRERAVDGDIRYVLEHSRVCSLEDDAPSPH